MQHSWRLVARDFQSARYTCTRCGCGKLTHNINDGWPVIKYVQKNGIRVDTRPDCMPNFIVTYE